MTLERWLIVGACFGISSISGFVGTISSLHSGVDAVKRIPGIEKDVDDLKILLLDFKELRDENHQILEIVSTLKGRTDQIDLRLEQLESEIEKGNK